MIIFCNLSYGLDLLNLFVIYNSFFGFAMVIKNFSANKVNFLHEIQPPVSTISQQFEYLLTHPQVLQYFIFNRSK